MKKQEGEKRAEEEQRAQKEAEEKEPPDFKRAKSSLFGKRSDTQAREASQSIHDKRNKVTRSLKAELKKNANVLARSSTFESEKLLSNRNGSFKGVALSHVSEEIKTLDCQVRPLDSLELNDEVDGVEGFTDFNVNGA